MILNKNKLELAMADNCMNYTELAQKAELSRMTIQKLLYTNRAPRPTTIGKLAKALNVKTSDIVDMEGEEQCMQRN